MGGGAGGRGETGTAELVFAFFYEAGGGFGRGYLSFETLYCQVWGHEVLILGLG